MPTIPKWFRISGTRSVQTDDQMIIVNPILFYVWETSKQKALIAASQAKITYMRQWSHPGLVSFDFGKDIRVIGMPKEWDPKKLGKSTDDQIIIVWPKDGNDRMIKVIGESLPSAKQKPQYIVLLKTATGMKVWTETADLIPYGNGVKGSIIMHNRRKHILVDVLLAPEEKADETVSECTS
jgi:hypothetical protein